MELKKCEFSNSPENEDVGFWFEVKVKTSDKKDVEFMLRCFDQVANDFKKTWQKRLRELR